MAIQLTRTVQKGGCAAKIAATTLREVLGRIDLSSKDPAVLIDGKNFDDAGIYRINEEVALVQTLDFFTPIVDTPFLFGQVAATNALSDVYAMGGTPKTAMAILAFPLSTLEPSVMREIMEGAMLKIREAGCSLLGGHSIEDDTLKFGLSVTGVVNPSLVWSNAGARAGDHLILTKAIGTGTLCAGLKNGDYSESEIKDAIDSMSTLNRVDDLLSSDEMNSIHAATDITGFGVLGHGYQLARASGVTLVFEADSLPLFERTISSLQAENLTRAHGTNRSYVENHTKIMGSPSKESLLCFFDPQTSGGLLLSVAPEKSASILTKLGSRFKGARLIGKVLPKRPHEIEIHD
ncbi:MAG: selenide, water dikinase SelD [Bdellovibrionales bacterium]|nr:selenide, water dikinase SelD [Bdellovibrionales bacterium]